MNEGKYNLLEGTVWKRLLVFLIPIALGTIIQQLYNAADCLIVGRFIGTEALAAVGGSSFQVTNLIVTFFASFSSGATVKIAQLYGSGQYREVKKSIENIVAVCGVIGFAVAVIGIILTPRILLLLKTPENTISNAILYLRIYLIGAVFIFILNIESSILRAIGDSRSPFIFMVICCVTNIVLDFLMVVPLGWGVAGAAIATVISQVINVILLTWKLQHFNGHNLLHFSQLKLKGEYLGSMMYVGLPSGAQSTVYAISNTVLQVGVNQLGTVFVASWAMATKVDALSWSITGAVGMAITTFMGQNYGAGRKDRMRDCVKQGYIMATVITIITSSLLLLAAPVLLNILTEDQSVVETTYRIMKCLVPFYCVWAVIEVFGGILKGVGQVVAPVLITCIGVGVFRIVWMLVVFPLNPGLTMIAINYIVSWAITAFALFLYYNRVKNKILN